MREARDIEAFIRPLLSAGKRQREAAAAAGYVNGEGVVTVVDERTVRRWIISYARHGIIGLTRNRGGQRADAGERRYHTWGPLDRLLVAAGWSGQQLAALDEEIKRALKGLWQRGTPSGDMVAQSIIGLVADRLHATGVVIPAGRLKDICKPPKHVVLAHQRHRLVNVRRNDAGRFADKHEPRVRRARPHLLPLQWVAADVAHLDTLLERADGTTTTPKLVVFFDLATNRVFCRTWLMARGEMIRREHVLQTFVDMCADPAWGVPTRVLIDRGGEFGALGLARDLFQLKQRVAVEEIDFAEPGVHRALPYGPEAKGVETPIGIIQRCILPCIEAYLAGDRMRKRTQSRGREPMPHAGGFVRFERELAIGLDFYHDKPQAKRSHLRGQSPNERLRERVANGWRPTRLVETDGELAVVFSEREQRVVQKGGEISFKGEPWRCDALMPMLGETVTVRAPLVGARGRMFVFDRADRTLLGVAEPSVPAIWGDIAGARERSRRSGVLRRQVDAMAAEGADIDPIEAMAATNRAFGPPPVPDDQAAPISLMAPDSLKALSAPDQAPHPFVDAKAKRRKAVDWFVGDTPKAKRSTG